MESRVSWQTSTAGSKIHIRKKVRQASWILPSTGQRIKRDFTLRDPRVHAQDESSSESGEGEESPLLPISSRKTGSLSRFGKWLVRARTSWRDWLKQFVEFWQSDVGHGILKCSLAYFLATLVTFAEPVSRIFGTQIDGNPIVANVVVWFDPHRSLGSMELATVLALLAFLYGTVVACSSMAVSVFFASHDLVRLGWVVVVIVFCGGSVGLQAWVKQYYNHPLINVATAVSSLSIIAVLLKEGYVQSGEFSFYRVSVILKMLVTGIIISAVINLVIWPMSARRKLRESLSKSTNAFGDMLAMITVSFLSGREEDLTHPVAVAASDRYKSVFSSLPTHLAEARYEHLLLGFEKRYELDERLVKCMQQLAQDIGGLRSAASMQFQLLSESVTSGPVKGLNTDDIFDDQTRNLSRVNTTDLSRVTTNNSVAIEESSERSSISDTNPRKSRQASGSEQGVEEIGSTTIEVFEMFIIHLGPGMRSLAHTLREILNDLPYQPEKGQEMHHAIFKASLIDAIKLFNTSRKEALAIVYKSKELTVKQAMPIVANFEEVAASCGQFASSLQDFAENCVKYIDVLDELQADIKAHPWGLSWRWLMFWRKREVKDEEKDIDRELRVHMETAASSSIRKPNAGRRISIAVAEEKSPTEKFPYNLYPYLRVWRREDVRFAIKVGAGAAIYAMFAYIPQTRSFFDTWHLEWGLVAYMIVCSMTVGASNTTGFQRFEGTIIGGVLAMVVWLICFGNPWALAGVGWLISAVCYYFAQARNQGPRSRFILLTYNISILYTYTLLRTDPDAGRDESRTNIPTIAVVVFHRGVAITIGSVSGAIVTRAIWPTKARRKLKYGLSLLWLRMALIWKQGPLSVLTDGGADQSPYSSLSSETQLRKYVDILDSVRKDAEHEFRLKGPFQSESYDKLLKSSTRMLNAFHALNVIIMKDTKASPGETEILRYTNTERRQLAKRISHLLSGTVLAASLSMEYPLTDALPDITHTRDRLLAKVFEFRWKTDKAIVPTDDDYEIIYAFALVTGEIAKEIEVSGKEMDKMFGTLDEDAVRLH